MFINLLYLNYSMEHLKIF